MKSKIVSMIAVTAAAAAGMIGLTVGTASAHALISYDCNDVTVNFEQFSEGPASATVTVNGTATTISWTSTGPSEVHTETIPFVSHAGDPDVVVDVEWQGPSAPGSESATFPTEECSAPPTTTTTPPTTTTTPEVEVSPAEVVRPVVAPAAVVAAPVFTG